MASIPRPPFHCANAAQARRRYRGVIPPESSHRIHPRDGPVWRPVRHVRVVSLYNPTGCILIVLMPVAACQPGLCLFKTGSNFAGPGRDYRYFTRYARRAYRN